MRLLPMLDIAYSDSPAASRACSASSESRSRVNFSLADFPYPPVSSSAPSPYPRSSESTRQPGDHRPPIAPEVLMARAIWMLPEVVDDDAITVRAAIHACLPRSRQTSATRASGTGEAVCRRRPRPGIPDLAGKLRPHCDIARAVSRAEGRVPAQTAGRMTAGWQAAKKKRGNLG